jgi:hypothetical protein
MRTPTLDDLFRKGVAYYLTEHAPFSDHLVAFMHIPKTAGNSVVATLKDSFSNIFYVRWNDVSSSFGEMIQAFPRAHYQVVTGHFRSVHVRELVKAGIPHINIAYIRHPIDRIVSLYRYMRTPAHPGHEEFARAYPTFEQFALEGTEDNVLTRCLVSDVQPAEKVFAEIAGEYAFIGLTEYINASTYLLQALLGCRIASPGFLNVTADTPDNAVEISPGLMQVLRDRHRVDIELFDMLRQEFQHIMDDVLAHAVGKMSLDPPQSGHTGDETMPGATSEADAEESELKQVSCVEPRRS